MSQRITVTAVVSLIIVGWNKRIWFQPCLVGACFKSRYLSCMSRGGLMKLRYSEQTFNHPVVAEFPQCAWRHASGPTRCFTARRSAEQEEVQQRGCLCGNAYPEWESNSITVGSWGLFLNWIHGYLSPAVLAQADPAPLLGQHSSETTSFQLVGLMTNWVW